MWSLKIKCFFDAWFKQEIARQDRSVVETYFSIFFFHLRGAGIRYDNCYERSRPFSSWGWGRAVLFCWARTFCLRKSRNNKFSSRATKVKNFLWKSTFLTDGRHIKLYIFSVLVKQSKRKKKLLKLGIFLFFLFKIIPGPLQYTSAQCLR